MNVTADEGYELKHFWSDKREQVQIYQFELKYTDKHRPWNRAYAYS